MQHWEEAAEAKKEAPSAALENRSFIYVKYWKPVGVTCTSDPSDKTNIIKAGQFDLFPQRLFTVGRLDKDSTGLILLTSDGRVNQAMLSPATKREKVAFLQFLQFKLSILIQYHFLIRYHPSAAPKRIFAACVPN